MSGKGFYPTDELGDEGPPMRDPWALTRKVSLRLRITLLSAGVVGIAVLMVALASYAVIYRNMYADVDAQLKDRAATITFWVEAVPTVELDEMLVAGKIFGGDLKISIYKSVAESVGVGGKIHLGLAEEEVIAGKTSASLRTAYGQRLLARRMDSGNTLVISKSLAPTEHLLNRLALILVVIGGCGVALAAVAGATVAGAGLRPVFRLTRAAARVARTDALHPIPVVGKDELATLTASFNSMLLALQQSREQQARLVADAGHELRTPLTSLRTNIEFLIAASKPGAPVVAEAEMAELRTDVIAQLEELSTLVHDLVGLAREEGQTVVREEIDLVEVLELCVERVRRRRNDINFVVNTSPWFVLGDSSGLSRAVLNVLDNAAKWSTPGQSVEITMARRTSTTMQLSVADSGPGIPLEERKLVFERFYRSTSSRSMPGSGLGLAIVRHVIVDSCGGKVFVGESATGGALVVIELPGKSTSA